LGVQQSHAGDSDFRNWSFSHDSISAYGIYLIRTRDQEKVLIIFLWEHERVCYNGVPYKRVVNRVNKNIMTNPLPQPPQRIPDVVLKTRVRDESVGGDNPYRWQDVSTGELFKGKKVVVFALPGAFTPTCSSTHLPGYEAKYDEFKALGVDEVYCLSVNDAFVMFQWAKHQHATKVKMLPDGSGLFTKAMGMLVKKDDLGFGERSWRYSMYVEDGEIKKLFFEPGFSNDCPTDPFEVSDADTMLTYLKENS
jgi:peroxiredoxin